MGAKGCGKTRIMGIVNSEPHKDAHMVTLYKACVRPSRYKRSNPTLPHTHFSPLHTHAFNPIPIHPTVQSIALRRVSPLLHLELELTDPRLIAVIAAVGRGLG